MSQFTRTIQRWLDELANIGTSLLLVLVIVDFMFPGSTGIVNNVATVLGGLNSQGQFALIALLLFLLVHHRWRTSRPPPSDTTGG